MVEQDEDKKEIRSRCSRWSRFTAQLKKSLLRGLIYTAKLSARRPVYTITTSISIALFFAIVGFFTNVRIEIKGSIL